MRILLSALLVLSLGIPTISFAEMAPLNPRYIEWVEQQKSLLKNREPVVGNSDFRIPPLTRRPSPVNREHMKNQSITSGSDARKALPVPAEAAYDLRDHGWVTPVRDQNPYGTCWAFGAMAASESSALKQGWAIQDFSEKHLAYFGYTDVNSTFVGFDRQTLPAPNSIYDIGGLDDIASAMLSRGTGIVAETTEPYQNMGPCAGNPALPAGVAPSATAPNAALLAGLHFAPSGSEVVGNIKYLLKTYGAVVIGVNWKNGQDYNGATNAFYDNNYTGTDHAVTVVGWDDSYSKENFNTQPTNDGAFIVRNSWGAAWGDSGYFWLSYEDVGIVNEGGFAYEVSAVDAQAQIYMYDPLGLINSISAGGDVSQQWMANIFTAQGNQQIDSIFLATMGVDTTATVAIYTGVTASQPTSGTLAHQSQATVLATSGYHTLDLSTPVRLKTGESFSVVVKLETAGQAQPIPVETTSGQSSKATASAGQSFASPDGTSWSDVALTYANTNVVLRAIATPASSSGAAVNFLLLGD